MKTSTKAKLDLDGTISLLMGLRTEADYQSEKDYDMILELEARGKAIEDKAIIDVYRRSFSRSMAVMNQLDDILLDMLPLVEHSDLYISR